jgi:hypothetical protein
MCWNAIAIYLFPCVFEYIALVVDVVLCGAVRVLCGAVCLEFKDYTFPPDAASIGAWDEKTAAEVAADIE